MNIKQFAVALIALLIMGTSLQMNAQTCTDKAKMKTKKMAEALKLDDKQHEKVLAINTKYAERMQAIKNADGDRSSKVTQIKSLREQQEREIQNILSKDQFAQLQVLKAEKAQKHAEKRNEHHKNMATPSERAQKRSERMTKELELNNKQTKAVERINLSYAEKIDAVRKDTKLEKFDKMEKIAALKDQQDKDFKKTLTPKQYETLEAKRKEHKGKRGEQCEAKGKGKHDAGNYAAKMTERMTEKLGLNDEQAAIVKAINETHIKNMREVRQSDADDASKKQKITGLMQQHSQALKKVLTKEQFAKFDQHQQAKKDKMQHHQGKDKTTPKR